MSGAGFILGINLAVAGLIASVFLAIAVYDPTRVAPRWFALGYFLGIPYYAVEATIPLMSDARIAVVVSFAILLAAMVSFNIGVARHYALRAPLSAMIVVFTVAIFGVSYAQELPRNSFERQFIYQLPYFVMQVICVGIVIAANSSRKLERVLVVLYTVSAFQFLSKPLIASAVGGAGVDAQAYLTSNYALISQSMGTVFALAVALSAMTLLMRAILEDANERSETDPLSGLLNRRGFEARADQALRAASRQRVPVSLVICDLDMFKVINDTYGHAAGDRVIRAFAMFLRSATDIHHSAGRIGGEEFAIVLPGSNLVAARLFAEGARSAFAATEIDGFPPQARFTASFGVAELMAGEAIGDLMRRADRALYEAKDAGRDCVRVSRPVPIDPPRQMAG